MAEVIYPKTNSLSPEKEQLKEIQEHSLDLMWHIKCDKRKDPRIFWKPVNYDPRYPNTDITR